MTFRFLSIVKEIIDYIIIISLINIGVSFVAQFVKNPPAV